MVEISSGEVTRHRPCRAGGTGWSGRPHAALAEGPFHIPNPHTVLSPRLRTSTAFRSRTAVAKRAKRITRKSPRWTQAGAARGAPVVLKLCAVCHGKKEGMLLGAMVYELPIQ